MAGSFTNGWRLAKQSVAVLREDKSLLVFPLLSGLACTAVLASFVVPIALSDGARAQLASDGNRPFTAALAFAFYFLNYLVMAFFNAALVACAIDRFRGGRPTVRTGLDVAMRRLPQIACWALVAATVGMVLRTLEQRAKIVGRIVIALLGAAWTFSTFFVVPVVVAEQAGPFAAIRRSLDLMERSWGTAVVGNASISLVVLLFYLLALAPMAAGFTAASALSGNAAMLPAVGGVVVSVAAMMLIALVASTVRTIQLGALYEYASSGQAPPQFDGELLQQAFRAKKR
jgi:hypothetical protein